jgi:dGTPase
VIGDYDAESRQRRVPEPDKRAGSAAAAAERGDFQRDRARVLHAYAFRRLADKTQVVAPGEDDFPRTRLTHSLEVAQIGREIGESLGCDPDLVDAAGLAHDIGHPPFGHNGEQALDAMAAPCGGFEGNAQTLRVLTRLEAKIVRADGQPAGLNLTRASLDAACKYPWPRSAAVPGEQRAKYGYYAADADAFAWMRAGAPAAVRCLEAQIMDWADDVAYSVHDVEDGVHAGLIRLGGIDDEARADICRIAAASYSAHSAADLEPVLDELLDLPTLRDLAGYDGTYSAQAAAKRATSELTGRFAAAAIAATRAAHGDEPLTRYAADLVVPGAVGAECALLKAIAVRYVMRRHGTTQRQQAERRLLERLVAAVAGGAPASLDPALTPAWRHAESDADRLRVIVDQVAQLTDSTARAWHDRLVRPDVATVHLVPSNPRSD